MNHSEEKPLIVLNGTPVIERVIRSLQRAKRVDSIIVAVSHHAPRTAAFAARFPVKIAPTPGKGYIQDLQYLVRKLGLGSVLTIGADLPLITSEIIDQVVDKYRSCGKSALAVATSMATKKNLGLGTDHSFTMNGLTLVPVGINVINGEKIECEELEQEVLVMDKIEVAVNINTFEELTVAEKLAQAFESSSVVSSAERAR